MVIKKIIIKWLLTKKEEDEWHRKFLFWFRFFGLYEFDNWKEKWEKIEGENVNSFKKYYKPNFIWKSFAS